MWLQKPKEGFYQTPSPLYSLGSMSCYFKGQLDWNTYEKKRVAISELKEESFQERI